MSRELEVMLNGSFSLISARTEYSAEAPTGSSLQKRLDQQARLKTLGAFIIN
jgi:hypothetical protein